MLVVQALAGVLLQMQPLDADGDALAAEQIDDDLALADDRALVLADLIALRQIGIEVVLAVEDRIEIDLRLQPEPGADGLRDAAFVDHRQHAGHGGIDQAHMGVGLAAELGRGAGEQLGVGGDLGMDLHADHHLPRAGRAFDQISSVLASILASILVFQLLAELLLLILDEPADHLPP